MPNDSPAPTITLLHDPRSPRALIRMGVGGLVITILGLLLGTYIVSASPVPAEQEILGAVADVRTDAGTTLLRGVSTALNLELSIVVALLVLPLLRWRTGGWAAPVLLVLAFAGSLLITGVIKVLVGRERPLEALVEAHSASFPSGHASRAAALLGLGVWAVTALVRHVARRAALTVLLVGAVLLVGWSRMYLGIHWPSDILFGLALGGAWVMVLVHALRPEVPAAARLDDEGVEVTPS
jgi:membrane-associated phospholipid phosphatase